MRHFATVFDSKYLPQGLALYESLVKHSSEEFRLTVLPLDRETFYILGALDLKHLEVTPFALWDEMPSTQAMKASRTYQEYCWSCASTFTALMMEILGGDWTYLDADLFFVSDPAPIFTSIGARSIAITPHRFPDNDQKARLEQSGKYNVGFVHFKNTVAGRECLARWAWNVRQQCSASDGCGDQCYLNVWEEQFGDEVAVLGHGINTGPWNLSAYEVSQQAGAIFLGRDPLYCYHFHEYVHGKRLTNYPLRSNDIRIIYDPYIAANCAAMERIAATHVDV